MNSKNSILSFFFLIFSYPGNMLAVDPIFLLKTALGVPAAVATILVSVGIVSKDAIEEELKKGVAKNKALARAQEKMLSKKATEAIKAQKTILKNKRIETEKDVTATIALAVKAAKIEVAAVGYNGALDGAGAAVNDAVESIAAGAITAAPWLGGIAIGSGGYLLYRYNYPYFATIAGEQTAIAERVYKKAMHTRKDALQTSQKSFHRCLRYHAHGELNAEGFPAACEDSARAYALLAGSKAPQKRIEIFKKEANRPSNVPLYGMMLLGIVSSASA